MSRYRNAIVVKHIYRVMTSQLPQGINASYIALLKRVMHEDGRYLGGIVKLYPLNVHA